MSRSSGNARPAGEVQRALDRSGPPCLYSIQVDPRALPDRPSRPELHHTAAPSRQDRDLDELAADLLGNHLDLAVKLGLELGTGLGGVAVTEGQGVRQDWGYTLRSVSETGSECARVI